MELLRVRVRVRIENLVTKLLKKGNKIIITLYILAIYKYLSYIILYYIILIFMDFIELRVHPTAKKLKTQKINKK